MGLQLVAICDTWEEKLREAGARYGVTTYTDYDKFLEHDLDAVVLANYFHEHAPFAIKALAAGKHVMSECTCNSTLAEGVALCRAVEQSGKIYMLAENYPYTAVQHGNATGLPDRRDRPGGLCRRRVQPPHAARGSCGSRPGLNHWRNWCPSTYYCTHALAPLMCITDARPLKVNGLSMPAEKRRRGPCAAVTGPR